MSNTYRKFCDAMNSFAIQRDKMVAVACSGGPDSMALAVLVQQFAQEKGLKLVALTVDHALRKESLAEAKQVAKALKEHRIPHEILLWKGKKPTANIQEAARNVRYRLLAEYCRVHKIDYLLAAHHLEDQAETFLLRLARGSGVDGLAAMSPSTLVHDITLLRPLLAISKTELLQFLKIKKVNFITDPSNENSAFDRVKIRKLLPALSDIGLTPARLAKTAGIMARARAHLEEETGQLLKTSCKIFPEGYALYTQRKVTDEIALRALATLIMIIGGHEVRTRLSDLERLHHALQAPDFKGATLAGCIFSKVRLGKNVKENTILMCREPKAVAKAKSIKPTETLQWDDRFEIQYQTGTEPLMISALGQEGWLFCVKHHGIKSTHPDKKILYTLPALRDKTGWLHAVPHMGLAVEGVKCFATFNTPV